MLNFRQIEVFRAVMIAKTVSGASRLLNVSQPGLSRTLRYTEDKLGFALFDRVSGRLVPTKEALELFKEIDAIYKRIEGLDFLVKRLERGEDAVFRVGAQPSAGHFIVPRALGALKRSFDKLVIQFDVLSLQQVTDYLLTGDGEYTVGTFAVDHPNVRSELLSEAPLVCVLAADHALAGKATIHVRDIADEPLISFQADTPHGAVINSAFRAAKVERHVSTFVRFAETACSFVRNGLGVAVVDAFTVLGDTGTGLVVRPLEPARTVPLYLNRNKLVARSLIADRFEHELRAVLQELQPALGAPPLPGANDASCAY